MDDEGELLFSESAEHLMDYEPPVEDDHGKKQKLSPKRALPESTTKKSPKKAIKKPFTSSKQSPSNKCKTLPSVASPKKKTAPSKKSTRGSPKKKSESPLKKNARKSTSKKQPQASDSSSSEKHTKVYTIAAQDINNMYMYITYICSVVHMQS